MRSLKGSFLGLLGYLQGRHLQDWKRDIIYGALIIRIGFGGIHIYIYIIIRDPQSSTGNERPTLYILQGISCILDPEGLLFQLSL